MLVTSRTDVAPPWTDAAYIRFARTDSADGAALDVLFAKERPDATVNLAWYTDPRDYLTNRDENVASLAAAARVLVAAAEGGCRHLVMSGTCLEAGTGARDTVYARTKSAMHAVASEYLGGDPPTVACAHIYSVYGPGEHPDRAIPSIIRALDAGRAIDLTQGLARRDYVHVHDVATALASITESRETGAIDICTGVARPLREIFSLLGDIIGARPLLRFGAMPSSPTTSFEVDGDPSRLAGLGWSPRYSLESGLRETVEWWRSERGARAVEAGEGRRQ